MRDIQLIIKSISHKIITQKKSIFIGKQYHRKPQSIAIIN